MDGPHAIGRAEAAIEHRKVFRLQCRRALNGAGGINVADNYFHLLRRVAQLDERLRHRVIHDLDNAAAHQFLELHQSQIRFNARGIAVHHKTDGPGGSDHRDLSIAVAILLAQFVGLFPNLTRRLEHVTRNIAVIDARDRIAVHADHFQEMFRIRLVAGERSRGAGDAGAGQVRLPVHDGGNGTRPVAAAVAVVRHAHRHQ